MASTFQGLARFGMSVVCRPKASIAAVSATAMQIRCASVKSKATKDAEKKSKRKLPKEFKVYDPTKFPQFSLCDAIRYLRAAEVGCHSSSTKYELAIRLRTARNGPVVRNTIKLPHPVRTSAKFGVICPEGSKIAQEALLAGAVAAGQESLFDRIRAGDMPFDRLICHEDSEKALNAAGLGRILGPKGMMPSRKLGTVTKNIKRSMQAGADEYRERQGVVRMAIGQLGFTPKMLAENVKAFLTQIKKECAALEDLTYKEVREVVLSSSKGPGLSLNGKFKSTDAAVAEQHLAGIM
ncbi:hypothetical protein TD95_002119 [Thielaviopsis punctulata]|uniref:Ribosomal protein L1 n=1 Tax=Thielaviopsis punctulata TaxID=72032 RepID=A0A0F4Z9T1_9PEZI|nr:hypothetical protein TD95_002119 [Thielaviopsis punctulata]